MFRFLPMKSNNAIQFRSLYEGFDAPLTGMDCGLRCAPHNPRGIPFCCDLEYTVPVAYQSEWCYLSGRTSLWRPWLSIQKKMLPKVHRWFK